MARRANNNFRTTSATAKGHHGGFTLLEVLVAIFIGSILTVVLFESLHVANLARNSTERAIAPSRTAQIALDMLRNDLTNVPPVQSATDSTKAATLATMFSGTQNSDTRGHEADVLDFFTLADGQLWPQSQSYANAGGGLGGVAEAGGGAGMGMPAQQYGTNGNWVPRSECKQVEITIDQPIGSSDYCLVRRVWNNVETLNQNFDTTNPDQEEVICRGVESFTVQYYDGYEWLDTWDSTQSDNQLPVAVQITLEIDPPATASTDRNAQPRRYTQVIRLPCSNAANDANVSTGLSGF